MLQYYGSCVCVCDPREIIFVQRIPLAKDLARRPIGEVL
jgi:hypothetical protein